MNAFLNQYSAIVFAFGGAAMLFVGMWRFRRPTRVIWRAATLSAYSLIVVVLLTGMNFPNSNAETNTYDQIDRLINNGRPTFIMMYSHFCVGCIASLPSMQQLEEQMAAQGQEIDAIFIDVQTAVGRVARDSLDFNYTPTFLLFDADGQQVLRTNTTPSMETLLDQLSVAQR